MYSSKSSLTIAIAIAAVRDQPVNACKSNSKNTVLINSTDRLKSLTSTSSLTSVKTFESYSEQPYVRTQLATATERSKIIKIKLISVKNHAYLLLTTFADPS